MKLAIFIVLVALGALVSAPARTDDYVHFIGRDDSGDTVGADFAPGSATKLTILQNPSASQDNACSPQPSYYALVTTPTAMTPGKNAQLSSCQLNRCTNPKLKQKCKGQPNYFTTPCTGSLDYQPNGEIRVELDYQDEYWDDRVCKVHHKKDRTSLVFLLTKYDPSPGDTSGKQLKCYMHNLLYPVKDHPLHEDCGQ